MLFQYASVRNSLKQLNDCDARINNLRGVDVAILYPVPTDVADILISQKLWYLHGRASPNSWPWCFKVEGINGDYGSKIEGSYMYLVRE